MDAFTLVVACMLLGVVMAGSMGLLYLSARQRCLLDWSAAGALFAVTSLLGAVASRHAIDAGTLNFLVPGIGNASYIAAHFGILAGLRRHLGLAPGWKWMGIVAALVAAAHALPFLANSVTHRLVLLTPLVAGVDLVAARLLWRRCDRDTRTVYVPLLALEVFFAVQMLLRAAYLAATADGTTLTFMGSQFLQTSGSLFVLVFLSVSAKCCVLIVTHHQEMALRQASLTDALTGWLNRRALNDIAAREFARSRRGGGTLYFITFDIDHFKAVNDRHGHAVGDAAIRHATALAAAVLRGYDALFRLGGEEFAVLVGDADADDVHGVAERLREHVAAHPLHIAAGTVAMTVSVGVAALEPEDARWEDVLDRADAALYHAKQHGRNRVSVLAGAVAAWA